MTAYLAGVQERLRDAELARAAEAARAVEAEAKAAAEPHRAADRRTGRHHPGRHRVGRCRLAVGRAAADRAGPPGDRPRQRGAPRGHPAARAGQNSAIGETAPWAVAAAAAEKAGTS